MITFDPFWDMMNQRQISIYDLEYQYELNPADISRLKHNHNYTLKSIDHFCSLFDCEPTDIIKYQRNK